MNKVFILFIMFTCVSCVYDKEENPLPAKNVIADNTNTKVDTILPCDTMVISYENDINTILFNNCSDCHTDGGSSGEIKLDSYNDVYKNKNLILKTIKHKDGVVQMPQGAEKLSKTDIQKMECWIKNGALNN